MPKILINEKDKTSPGTPASYANYSVLITGFSGKTPDVFAQTYSKDQLEDLAESFETLYDIDEKDVKAAKRFHVKVVYDNDGEKTIDYVTVTVVKVGKKWSIYRGLI